mgnify:CR=1 FL=1
MNLNNLDFKKLGIKDKEINLYLVWFNLYLEQFKINTPNRLIAFFGNLLHESNYFKNVLEIASGTAYEGNKNLGNIQKGDGVRFKGRGLGQITGRWNYQAFTDWVKKTFKINVDFVKNPELLEKPQWAVLSAFWYWEFKKLTVNADKGEFTTVAAIWNTGNGKSQNINGMRDRVDKENIVKQWLSSIINENI